MRFIKSFNLRNLRALEYNQVIIDILTYVKALNFEELKLKLVVDALEVRALHLNETLVNGLGSLLTATLVLLDDQRDRVVRAFRSAVKSGMNSTVEERAAAATKLFFIFNKFGNIPTLSREQETSAIRQLLDELNEEENKKLVELLHVAHWMEELKEVNEKYAQAYIDRTQETGEKQAHDVVKARLLTQDAFEDLCVIIEACIILYGATAYTDLVAFINNEVAQAKQSANMRVIMKKKNEEKKDENNEEKTTPTTPPAEPTPKE